MRPDLNIEKVNMPENMLYYVNQSFLSTIKNCDIAMYNHNFILGQILVAANQLADISSYVCKKNEVQLYCWIYDLSNGQFQGVKEQLAYNILRGDTNEIFFSYGYDSSKSKVFHSFLEHQMPDAFVWTSFKKYFNEIKNEKRGKWEFSIFLSSINNW